MGQMNIREVAKIVEGEILCAGNSKEEMIERGFASDLMSDVLTLNTDSLLLITGLANLQTIRTAEMAEIKNILFVRGKRPSTEMIELAKDEGINLIVCKKSMFVSCGILHKAGLEPVY